MHADFPRLYLTLLEIVPWPGWALDRRLRWHHPDGPCILTA